MPVVLAFWRRCGSGASRLRFGFHLATGSRSDPELTWVKALRIGRGQYIRMEDQDRDVLAVARAAVVSFGADTPGIMDRRAEAHLCADEWEGAEFWQRVADAARMLLAGRSRTLCHFSS